MMLVPFSALEGQEQGESGRLGRVILLRPYHELSLLRAIGACLPLPGLKSQTNKTF